MHPAPTPAISGTKTPRSFAGQVGFLVVAILIVTGLFNWTAAGRTMANFTRSEVERSTRSMAQAAADRIALLMTLGSIELAQAAEDPDLRAKDPIVTREALRRIQQNLRAEFPFETISVVDTDGRQRAIDPVNPALAGADLAGHYCIGHLMATGKPYVSDAFHGRTGSLLTVIAVPITDPTAGTVGVLAGNLYLDMETGSASCYTAWRPMVRRATSSLTDNMIPSIPATSPAGPGHRSRPRRCSGSRPPGGPS